MNSTTRYFPPESGPLSLLTRPVAVLRHNPDQLAARASLRFRAAHDDLDLLQWAEVIGASGRRYALVRHQNSPQAGTEVVTVAASPDPWTDIVDVLRGLDLSEDDVAWTAPDVTPRKEAAPRRVKKGESKRAPHAVTVWRLPLSAGMLKRLQKPIRGHGGFQSLLRKLQKQLDGDQLLVSAKDFERLLRYSAEYGAGGFQQRASLMNSRRLAAKKR